MGPSPGSGHCLMLPPHTLDNRLHVIGFLDMFPHAMGMRRVKKNNSDTGNRTPSCRVRGGNVSRYTISDAELPSFWSTSWLLSECVPNPLALMI